MSVKWKHGDEYAMYYCTFICYKWLHLFEIVNGYDLVYKWFYVLGKNGWQVIGFTIMSSHVHVITPLLVFKFSSISIVVN